MSDVSKDIFILLKDFPRRRLTKDMTAITPRPNGCTSQYPPPNQRLSALCLALLCAALNSVQAARTIPVTSADESGPNTLRDAIANAADGDTIVLAVPTQPGETAVFQMSTIFDDADNFMGPTATPMITKTIIIEARGSRLEHVPNGVNFRAFAVRPGGAHEPKR